MFLRVKPAAEAPEANQETSVNPTRLVPVNDQHPGSLETSLIRQSTARSSPIDYNSRNYREKSWEMQSPHPDKEIAPIVERWCWTLWTDAAMKSIRSVYNGFI